jgi:uncharacterized delta-60 repeat protein
MKNTPVQPRRLFFYVLIPALTLFAVSSAYVRPADSAGERQDIRALAAPGELDPTFDTDGKVVTPFPNGLDAAEDVAVQADGKVVVAGGSGSDFSLARYNTDGSLDTSFGTGGRVHTNFPLNAGSFASALVIQPDGKIVLAGSASDLTQNLGNGFALARYNSNGTLDTSFDTDGTVITPFPGGGAEGHALALQPDGKLVVAGVRRDFTISASVFALARYNTDGSLDTSFDTDGRVTIDFAGGAFDEAYGVGVQADGKIVAVGVGPVGFAVARLNTTGTPDTTFDTDGQVTTDVGGSFEQANAVVFQTDAKIVVAGEIATSTAADDNFALVRYNTDGSLDNTFDGDGKVITDFGLVDGAHDVVLQPDGRIVAAGRAGTIPAGTFFALARYNTNGSLDTSFDTDGKVLTDVSGGRFNLGGRGVALYTDGRIVVAGGDNTSGQLDFGVVRYNPNGASDTSFDTDGKAITDFPLNEETITDMAIQPDGKIVAVGRMNARIIINEAQDFNFLLARYNPDGSLDTSFGTGGIVSTDFTGNGDDFARAVVLQPDGRVVVAGQTGGRFSIIPSADTSFGVARYNPNGTLDTSFGTGGRVVVDFGSGHDSANAIALQTDGKIVLAGSDFFNFKLARLNTDGSLDSGAAGDLTPADMFGTGGKVSTDINETFDAANAVVIQPDGRVVAAGYAENDFALARYNSDGTLDTTGFGTGGKVTTDFNGGLDRITSLVRQADGKLVAAGEATISENDVDFALARYDANGTLDTAGFGTGGKVTTSFGGFDLASDLALQADGKIVAVGLYFPLNGSASAAPRRAHDEGKVYASPREAAKTVSQAKSAAGIDDRAEPAASAVAAVAFFAVARYNTNGSLDNAFDGDGKTTTDFFGVENEAFAVVIQSDGKIVAGGFTDNGSSRDFALARYEANPAAPPPPTPTPRNVQFSQSAQAVSEGAGSVAVTVTRTGETTVASTVEYSTSAELGFTGCDIVNGTASERCDFTTTLGTLRFAAGDVSKTINVFITDDAYVEGAETFSVTLTNATNGFTIAQPVFATVTITDNDTTPTSANPIDDPTFFVKMHYVDFLNREGEPAGVAGWVNSLNTCPRPVNPLAPSSCDRVEVSSRFFRSEEYMLKGNFVIRFYRVSLGMNPGYRLFTRDSQRVTGQTAAEVFANRDAFTGEWVERADFRAIYDGLSNQAYVDKLEQTAGVTLSNKAQLVADLNSMAKTRAQVLREVVESNEVKAKMYNDAFVLMEYFGYLRRDPEPAGFNAWLAYLNANPTDYRTMVRGFINSVEYRKRFGNPGPPQPGQF